MEATENKFNPLYNLPSITLDQARETIGFLLLLQDDAIDLFPRNNARTNHVNRYLILALLQLYVGKSTDCMISLRNYAEYCRKIGNPANPTFLHLLATLEGKEISDALAQKIISDPKWALQNIGAPVCFDCERCRISECCRIGLLNEIEDKMQATLENYKFHQYTFPKAYES